MPTIIPYQQLVRSISNYVMKSPVRLVPNWILFWGYSKMMHSNSRALTFPWNERFISEIRFEDYVPSFSHCCDVIGERMSPANFIECRWMTRVYPFITSNVPVDGIVCIPSQMEARNNDTHSYEWALTTDIDTGAFLKFYGSNVLFLILRKQPSTSRIR